MKYLNCILLTLILILVSCKDGIRPDRPENLISEEKMKAILYDLYVINAAKSADNKTLNAHNIIPETYILNKHNIDSAQFVNSHRYYAFDIEAYTTMLTSVQQKIGNEAESYKNKLKEEKQEKSEGDKKRDSAIKASIESLD